MSDRSEADWQELRRQVLGLGSGSTHKSHYPSLRQRVLELERFRSMVDLSGDLLFVLDATTRVVIDANSTATERLGIPYASLVGKPFAELLLPEKRDAFANVLDDFRRCLVDAQTLVSDLPSREGPVFPAEITVRCGSSGGNEYAVLAARDITERRKAEARLRQIAKVFASTHEAVVISDTEGTILDVNPAFTVISGYSEAEAIGQNPRLLKSERHDRDFYQAMWRDLLTTGLWQGEIWNRRKTGEVYPGLLTISAVRNDEGEVTNYVGVFTDLSRIKNSEKQLEFLAHHDALTGLPNRLLLISRVEHAVERSARQASKGAVLFLDLDRFKNVNDSLGHTLGDELLKIVAQRLRERLREIDTLARLGGDEFVVMLEEIRAPAQVVEVAQDLLARLAAPIVLPGAHEVYVTASIGITLFPDDATDAGELIQHADAALYQAKASGRNTFHFYTAALTRAANERLELEAALRRALENREFVLHYQPLVALQSGHIYGVEALVRWQCSDGRLVPPARFIPLAEETGLIVPLGDWVLREACACMRAWLDEGLGLETMAVNLSPLQFDQPRIHERILAALSEARLPGRYLELEITESAIMKNVRDSNATLAALKSLGVRIAIDDFGTGYSSLGQLKRFPIDKLKIDMSFVQDIPRDPADMEIVTAIIAMGRSLRLEVLAEGVEEEAQCSFLKEHGCETGQGYFFSRPLPRAQIAELLRAQRGG